MRALGIGERIVSGSLFNPRETATASLSPPGAEGLLLGGQGSLRASGDHCRAVSMVTEGQEIM